MYLFTEYEKELVVLEALPPVFTNRGWITRESHGRLEIHTSEPRKVIGEYGVVSWYCTGVSENLPTRILFQSISSDDEKATYIPNLIKSRVEALSD